MFARGLRGLGLTVVAAPPLMLAYSQYDEGFKRSCQFWYSAFPIYVHYRGTQILEKYQGWDDEKSTKEWNKLHEKYAPIAEEMTFRMRGFYLKQAQLLSTRDDFVPAAYMKWLKKTQSEAPTEFEKGEWRNLVEKQLNKKMSDVFEWWDDEPLGIASIGEVHRARLHGGKEVVIKVQSPGIEHRFRSDIKTTIAFCKLAMPHHVAPMEEIEKQFITEFDYVAEANNLEKIASNVMPVWGDRVCIPRPVMPLCTREVLVMDFLPGDRLVDGVRDFYREYAKRNETTLEELEKEQKRKIKSGEIKLRSPEEEAVYLDNVKRMILYKDVVFSCNIGRFFYNYSPLRLITGPMEYQWSKTPINLGEVLQLLMAVHAHEIFNDGAFNGDPHPGNILLMPDGRLGLIDYGQVKEIDMKTRIVYAKLILAIASDDKEKAMDISFSEEGGLITKHMNRDVMYKYMLFYHDRDTKDVTDGKNLQEFMDWVQEVDPLVEVNSELVMCGRVSIMMRGMGLAFGMRLRTAPYFAPYAEKLLQDQNITDY